MSSEEIQSIKQVDIPKGKFCRQSGYEITTNKQKIHLLIDSEQWCCEHAGYFMSEDNVSSYIGAKLQDIRLTDTGLNEAQFEKNNVSNPSSEWFEGGLMFVDLVTDRGVLQFVAYNEHNGYYGHEAVVKSTQLNCTEVL